MKLRTFFFALLIASNFVSKAFAYSGSGGGIEGNPFIVTTCAQFWEVQFNTNNYFSLANDIDCSSQTFDYSDLADFGGNFEGNFHTISNFSFTDTNSSEDQAGLFGILDVGAVVKDLIIANANISTTASEIGVLAGEADSATITNVKVVNGSVSGDSAIGGLIGEVDGELELPSLISGSSSTASVTSTGDEAGGLIGRLISYSNVTDSFSSSTINGEAEVGGLVGSSSPDFDVNTIGRCYASGALTCGFTQCGGLIGYSTFTDVTDSFAIGSVSFTALSEGGFIGHDAGSTTLSGDFFDITGTTRPHCIEGFDVTGCTGVNASNLQSTYFLGNNTNAPMNVWDFSNEWNTKSDALPVLHAFTVTPTPTPTATPTATPTRTPVPTATPIGKSAKIRKPTATVKKSTVTLHVKETIDARAYYVVIIKITNQKLYKKVILVSSHGSGTAVVKKVPAGMYTIYTLVKTTQNKFEHSATGHFKVV